MGKRVSVLRAFIFLALLFACAIHPAKAQSYQWCATINAPVSPETNGRPEAFLWIPDTCTHVNAVVFSQQNMTEETIFNSALFRETCSRLGFAIVWVAPYFEQKWDGGTGCNRIFAGMMDSLALLSGYGELSTAPVVPVGHSAMATMPWNFAAYNPDRTLAVISYHGDAPRTNLCGYGRENVEWGRTRIIDGIPGLMVEGEWEWWEARVNPALSFRMKYPGSCISFLCDAGHGHFDATEQSIDYVCRFIEKAAKARLTASGLKKIDPNDGYFMYRWDAQAPLSAYEPLKGVGRRASQRAIFDFEKRTRDCFWYIDKEMAELARDIYSTSLGKKQQYIAYTQDGRLLDYNPKLHAGTIIEPRFKADGLTFNIGAAFADSTRTVRTGKHSANPIRISVINGPCVQIDDTTFRFDEYRIGMDNKRRSTDIWLQAIGEADGTYKGTAQQLNVHAPYKITGARNQVITFKPLPDVSQKVRSVRLKASSTSRRPVNFYVKYGPAHVEGNKLILEKLPPRAKFPVRVGVVAWQYGVAGEWNSAESVERTFVIK